MPLPWHGRSLLSGLRCAAPRVLSTALTTAAPSQSHVNTKVPGLHSARLHYVAASQAPKRRRPKPARASLHMPFGRSRSVCHSEAGSGVRGVSGTVTRG